MWLQSARIEGASALVGERPRAPLFDEESKALGVNVELGATLRWEIANTLYPANRLASHYRTAWALVAFLAAERPEVLRALIAQGNVHDPEASFRALVPDLAEVARRLGSLARQGRPLPRRVPVAFAPGPIAVRELGHAEVHGLFARLYAHGSDPSGRARAAEEGREALRLDPDEPLGILYGAPGAPADRLRALTRARPDDWRAFRLLERALVDEADQAERAAARARAAALQAGGLNP